MLANIREKDPAKRIVAVAIAYRVRSDELTSFLSILFEKQDVPPGGSAEVSSVIIGVSRPREAVIGHFVPFFARDLARFTADTDSRIGEETNFDIFLHVVVPALIRTVCALADHRVSIFPSKPWTPPALAQRAPGGACSV